MKIKYPIIENAKRQARMIFLGIAIPTEVKNIDGEMVQVEKVLKFNRKALKNIGKRKVEKVDPRVVGSVDSMVIPVGKPGSRERVEALRSQYEAIAACGEEISPFSWKDE
jgi:hypothetical protein